MLALEGVFLSGLKVLFGIEQAEAQIESAPHFHQPLMQQGVGYHDQHPLGPAGEQLVMDDESGLDGLAQADFVRQQDAGRHAMGHLVGDEQLVRNGAGATAAEPPHWRLFKRADQIQRFVAQAEQFVGIELSGEQSFLRFVELQVRV